MYTSERFFVKTAHEQMCLLEAIWSPADLCGAPKHPQDGTLPALETIKSAAQSVQARGVYRIASLCADIYSRLGIEGVVKLRGSLAGLKCLVYQYADGLFEIDPQFKEILIGDTQGAKAVSELEIQDDECHGNLEIAHSKAGETLEPLLRFVKTGTRKNALARLIGRTDLAATTQIRETQSFETLMRPITNLALSEARHSGKRVSISYAADFDELEQSIAEPIQTFLEIMCLNIVSSGIGAERTQISLTGQMHSDTIGMNILWAGYDISDAADLNTHLKRAIKSVQDIGGEVIIHTPALVDTQSIAQNNTSSQSVEVVFPRRLEVARSRDDLKNHRRERRLR